MIFAYFTVGPKVEGTFFIEASNIMEATMYGDQKLNENGQPRGVRQATDTEKRLIQEKNLAVHQVNQGR